MRAIVIAVSLTMVQSCAHLQEDWIFTPDAVAAEAATHRALAAQLRSTPQLTLGYNRKEFVITGHRLGQGEGAVLAFRSLLAGPTIDGGEFKKMTIFLPSANLRPGMSFEFPSGIGALAFYSEGSSNFPGAGGCLGYPSGGSVKIDNISETQATVTVDLNFQLVGPLAISERCKARRVAWTHVLKRQVWRDLTPWLGLPGRSLYQESGAANP